jgi:hypothetical protein
MKVSFWNKLDCTTVNIDIIPRKGELVIIDGVTLIVGTVEHDIVNNSILVYVGPSEE